MTRTIIGRPAHRNRRGVFLSILALTISAASSPQAASTPALNSATATPAVLHATATINALLLRQEYSLFYGGFDY